MKSNISKSLESHDCERITQGDILRDFSFYFADLSKEIDEISFEYVVILSQDCDLEQGQKFDYLQTRSSEEIIKFNQLLPNVIFTPAFLIENIKKGEHLKEFFNITCDTINSDKLKLIKQNKDERYHFINGNIDKQVPDLIIDFKLYFTSSIGIVLGQYKDTYIATLNELFRESLSQRYCNYLNRIGLPEV